MVRDKGRWTYQLKKYVAAKKYIKHYRRALDIGGHIGLWAINMLDDFEHVEVFEPTARHRECFVKNIKADNVALYPFACGEESGRVSMGTPRADQTGHTVVVPGDDVERVVLDDYQFRDVDFIKIDVEGYEAYVVRGLESTIKLNKPVVILEQKPGKPRLLSY
jgi:FkbM family methyltransferase